MAGHLRERFQARARALIYARLALMAIGLAVLVVPAWRLDLGIPLPAGVYWYLVILAHHVASYLRVDRPDARTVIFVSLCLDLLTLLILVGVSGGMSSPLLPTQLLFTMLFTLLFPSPLALVPPLLTLPVVARLDLLLGARRVTRDLLVVLWTTALNITVVYVTLYLDGRDRQSVRDILRVQERQREADLEAQRIHLARELHDSVGAALSGALLQAEYLLTLVDPGPVRDELVELRESASEGMEELRRAVALFRREFQLAEALTRYARTFGQRHHLEVHLETRGAEPADLDPEPQLALFRVAQEALANVARHAAAARVEVALGVQPEALVLEVKDDGQGFDPHQVPVGHFGLRTMQERMTSLGGTLTVETAPDAGTRVTARIPTTARSRDTP